MSWGVSPWVYPVWDSLGFLDLGDYFLPHFRESEVAPSCLTLCDPMDCSPPGSSIHGILQVILEWVAIVFNYYLLKYFLMVFLFFFFFWDAYDSNVRAFNIVPEVSEVVLISFNSLFSSLLHLFLPFYLLPHLSYLLPLLFYWWFLPECFYLIYCIIHYILSLFYFF